MAVVHDSRTPPPSDGDGIASQGRAETDGSAAMNVILDIELASVASAAPRGGRRLSPPSAFAIAAGRVVTVMWRVPNHDQHPPRVGPIPGDRRLDHAADVSTESAIGAA